MGLGVKQGQLTLAAKEALDGAEEIIARTSCGCAFESLSGYSVRTLDEVFSSSRNFDTLNKKLAAQVISAGRHSRVCYCVEGAVSEDIACSIILSKVKDVNVCEGVSRISHIKELAKLTVDSVTALSAYSIRTLKSCEACVVYDMDDEYAASEVKQVLSNLFGEESECVFVCGDVAKKIKIYEIDRQKVYGGDCGVAVQQGDFLHRDRYDYADLLRLVALLRAPDGCPWDRVQTNESIKQNVIEEAYELADAIDRQDDEGIQEETGDVLLQAAFHSVLKEEQGVFNATDAISAVVKKLIFRHSHIFGKDKASSESEALGVWDKNKAEEKHMKTFGDRVLAVPVNMPACMRAQKVGKRAAKSGMDFSSVNQAAEKLEEEIAELEEALSSGVDGRVAEEAGDLLFSAVNTCRLAGVDCEDALSRATKKFTDRFVECERLIIADGKDITSLGQEELDEYWEKAKNART